MPFLVAITVAHFVQPQAVLPLAVPRHDLAAKPARIADRRSMPRGEAGSFRSRGAPSAALSRLARFEAGPTASRAEADPAAAGPAPREGMRDRGACDGAYEVVPVAGTKKRANILEGRHHLCNVDGRMPTDRPGSRPQPRRFFLEGFKALQRVTAPRRGGRHACRNTSVTRPPLGAPESCYQRRGKQS